MRLAQLALEAASAVSGVVGADVGSHGLCVTTDPPTGLMRGVSVIAQADGRYAVDLCLVAGIVPLLQLGEEVRSKVRARVQRQGLVAQLGEVNVEFVRVLSAEEISEKGTGEREEVLAATPPPTLPGAVSASAPIAPPPASTLPETLAREAAPAQEKLAAEVAPEEVAREREEVARERALVARERTLVARERTLVAREREEVAREREELLGAEEPPARVEPSVSPSGPIASPAGPVDGEQLS